MGAWLNVALIALFAHRAGLLTIDRKLMRDVTGVTLAGAVLGISVYLAQAKTATMFANWALREEMTLLVLAGLGGIIYAAILLGWFRGNWRALWRIGHTG